MDYEFDLAFSFLYPVRAMELREMVTVTFYYRYDQAESLDVRNLLLELAKQYSFEIVEINIDLYPTLVEAYGNQVPVVQVGPYVLKNPIRKMECKAALQSAIERYEHPIHANQLVHQSQPEQGIRFSNLDRLILWLSRHYVALFSSMIGLFVGLSFLAPVLMKVGWTMPAKAIYTVYSPLCHQLSFRSWFLFGEQAYYPRRLAGIEGVKSFEEVFDLPANAGEETDLFIMNARYFEGNDRIGYKVALCQRDIAIYLSFLLFGLLFALNGRRIKSIPWLMWLLIGVLPMGLDGFSQFPGLMSGLPGWLPIRESTPFIRTLTGSLFGVTSAWYLYPFLEDSMQETRTVLSSKKAMVDQSTQTRVSDAI